MWHENGIVPLRTSVSFWTTPHRWISFVFKGSAVLYACLRGGRGCECAASRQVEKTYINMLNIATYSATHFYASLQAKHENGSYILLFCNLPFSLLRHFLAFKDFHTYHNELKIA